MARIRLQSALGPVHAGLALLDAVARAAQPHSQPAASTRSPHWGPSCMHHTIPLLGFWQQLQY